jgi:hypothetical protein
LETSFTSPTNQNISGCHCKMYIFVNFSKIILVPHFLYLYKIIQNKTLYCQIYTMLAKYYYCCLVPFLFQFSREFEDTKGIIRISISKKNRQHNGQKKKYKKRSKKHTHKATDWGTHTPKKTGVNSGAPEG